MKILLAIDGSVSSDNVVEEVLSQPWPEKSECIVVTVAEPLHNIADAVFGAFGAKALEAQKALDGVVPEPRSVMHSRFFKDPQIDKAHQELYAAQRHALEKLVKDSATKIESKLVKNKVTYHVLEGNARSLILQIAQDWPADMIILGAHDRDKDVLEHFLGSVAQAIVNNADCSIEIVRAKK
jgi:nucleotide-binding universal stress UspA family protein